ncbi:MAG: glycoside hydrolase family 127 protein, partial [Lentisphaeria bacterium]|nr:glycoside hydrolase family 127 protein [Lentisphaeria bacterium]
PATPGTYLTLEREWKNGDTIELSFDLTPQLQKDPGGSGRIAFKVGPIVLAQDSRLNNGESDLPVSSDLPVRLETKEGFSQIWKTANGVLLCDYMSAGNSFQREDRLTVWSKEA